MYRGADLDETRRENEPANSYAEKQSSPLERWIPPGLAEKMLMYPVENFKGGCSARFLLAAQI
jgi:hypothetical protein